MCQGEETRGRPRGRGEPRESAGRPAPPWSPRARRRDWPELTLPLGAEKGRAAGLDDAPDALGAIAAGAALALPSVNRPAVLEAAELAVRLDIIAQRRPAPLDRLAEDAADRAGTPPGAGAHA